MIEPEERDVILFRQCAGCLPGGRYPLELCENPTVMRALLDDSIVRPSAKVKTGDSLLVYATLVSNAAVVSLLIERGADVNEISRKRNRSVLDAALLSWLLPGSPVLPPPPRYFEKGFEVICILMRHGARRKHKSNKTNEEQFASLYRCLSALCVLCTPLRVVRFHKSRWLSLDLLRLIVTYLN